MQSICPDDTAMAAPNFRFTALVALAGTAVALAGLVDDPRFSTPLLALAALAIIALLARGFPRPLKGIGVGRTSDPLTGVMDRRGFIETLRLATDRAKRADTQIGLLVLDLDRFHAVNDTWGHATGDAVLRETVARIRAVAGSRAEIARISGDEFALLLEGDANPRSLKELARNLFEALARPYQVNASSISISACAGIAVYPVNAEDADHLFRGADLALHRAKREGRSRVRAFDTELQTQMRRSTEMEHDLRKALENDEFVVFYQPQMELATGDLRGYEALVRWDRPGTGIIPPMEFIPVAEATGLIRELGERVLRRACHDATPWLHAGTVAVNFSPAQFQHGPVDEMIAKVLDESGLAPERLEIEVSESVFLQQSPDTMAMLDKVKALGVRIAMDDFGTGYSSLAYLTRFPFDKIKIDRSFVAQLSEDPGVATIIASIVGLGRSLSVDITAEGVETEEQVTMLKAAGCRIVQGFLFGTPQREVAPAGGTAVVRPGQVTS